MPRSSDQKCFTEADKVALPVVHDAVELLIALGYKVVSHSFDLNLWCVERYILTAAELIGFAVSQGMRPANDRIQ